MLITVWFYLQQNYLIRVGFEYDLVVGRSQREKHFMADGMVQQIFQVYSQLLKALMNGQNSIKWQKQCHSTLNAENIKNST